MATLPKAQKTESTGKPKSIDLKYSLGKFNLSSIDPQPRIISYEDELLTAEEKATYYEDLVRNSGAENFEKQARNCKKRANEIEKKIARLDCNEALPLLEIKAGLESQAEYYEEMAELGIDPRGDDPGSCERVIADDSILAIIAREFPPSRDILEDMALPSLVLKSKSNKKESNKNDCPDIGSMQELKRKARFWKNLHSWNHSERLYYFMCGPVKPPEWTEAMFVHAQRGDLNAVDNLVSQSRNPTMLLLQLAEMGNEFAAMEVVKQLEKYVRLLNIYAKTNPRIFKSVGGKLMAWPVMHSAHPMLRQDSKEIESIVGLGRELEFEFGPHVKWNPNKMSCKIAMHLFKYIKTMRQYPESNELSPYLAKALELPDINKFGAARKWWVLAKEVLDVDSNKNLDEDVQDLRKDEILQSLTKIKNKAKRKSKILEIIYNSFISLFPNNFR